MITNQVHKYVLVVKMWEIWQMLAVLWYEKSSKNATLLILNKMTTKVTTLLQFVIQNQYES